MFVVFAAFNLALFFFANMVFIAPVADSLRNARAAVRLQERIYSAELEYLASYEENLRELAEIKGMRRGLAYNEMLPALAEISELGAMYELSDMEFYSSGIARGDFFYEMRVRAEYEGDFNDVIIFLRDFSVFLETRGNTRSFSIFSSDIMEEKTRLRMEFSLYGSNF
jgi:hypothetical protein